MHGPEPFSAEDLAAIRAHPRFREQIEVRAAANLARYRGLGLADRWMTSDLGRAAMSSAAMVLEANGQLTVGALMSSMVVANQLASRGRVRAFLVHAVAHGMMTAWTPSGAPAAVPASGPLSGATQLRLEPRFVEAVAGGSPATLAGVAVLAPEVAPALALVGQLAYRRATSMFMGALAQARPDLFPAAGRPVHLFQGRDGGSQMLLELIVLQRPGRKRLLEDCELSRSALARAALCSRTHVSRLLRDGEAAGWLRMSGRTLHVAPEMSDDVEQYFAFVVALTRSAALAALGRA